MKFKGFFSIISSLWLFSFAKVMEKNHAHEVRPYFSVSLHKSLEETAENLHSSLTKVCTLLLEVMQAAVTSEPAYKTLIRRPALFPKRHDAIKIRLEEGVYDFYFHWANSVGMSLTSFIQYVMLEVLASCPDLTTSEYIQTREQLVEKLHASFESRLPVKVN